MKPHAKTALSLALAIVGGIAAGMRCDASVTVETPTQINPRVAAYTVKTYTEGSDPFVQLMRRLSVVLTFLLGARFFHETNLVRKGIALAAIVAGVSLLCLAS